MSVEVPDLLVEIEALKWIMYKRAAVCRQFSHEQLQGRIQAGHKQQKEKWSNRKDQVGNIYRENHFSKGVVFLCL